MIRVTNAHKAYGPVQALKAVSFDIRAGEIVGLLGPNGAGKTTVIKLLTGYLQPDEGEIIIDGLDVLSDTTAVQARIGYLPENAPLYPELTVQAYLQMMAGLRQIPPEQVRRHLSDAVHAAGLADHLTRPIGQLSKGFRQRVGLAQAILHKPRLLILDEPTVGLDPTQIVEIRGLIRRLAQHSTILFSTHILPEVEALCDRVLILINGELKVDARLEELAVGNDALLVVDALLPDAAATLREIDGVTEVTALPQDGQTTLRVTAAEGVDLTPALYQVATAHQWPIRELRRDAQTLETVFNRVAVG